MHILKGAIMGAVLGLGITFISAALLGAIIAIGINYGPVWCFIASVTVVGGIVGAFFSVAAA